METINHNFESNDMKKVERLRNRRNSALIAFLIFSTSFFGPLVLRGLGIISYESPYNDTLNSLSLVCLPFSILAMMILIVSTLQFSFISNELKKSEGGAEIASNNKVKTIAFDILRTTAVTFLVIFVLGFIMVFIVAYILSR